MPERVGVLAGQSPLPERTLRRARELGVQTVVAGLAGSVSRETARLADVYRRFPLGQAEAVLRFFREHGATRVLMVGRVGHRSIFSLTARDATFRRLWEDLPARTPTRMLSAVVNYFAAEGLAVEDSTRFLQDWLAREGDYTPEIPLTASLRQDIEFGWEKAWGIAHLDIGQTVCVCRGAVVAVEAMEGTDRAIARAGELAPAGMVMVKVSRPGQELRFDVPVIGPRTIRRLARHRAAALVVEAGRTLLVEPQRVTAMARRAGVALWGKS
jgi:UDP-2,3-diacylglucosamine hydrolase